MRKLEVYVCENFKDDYSEALCSESFEDVTLKAFPCYCTNRKATSGIGDIIDAEKSSDTDVLVLCGRNCGSKHTSGLEERIYKLFTSDFCFSYLVDSNLLEYILKNGGYILTCSWLKNWRTHLENDGFDMETARRFFSECFKELVLLDTGTYKDSESELRKLSEYLRLPYVIMNIGLNYFKIYLRSLVYEWKALRRNDSLSEVLSETRKESAEYSTVINLIEQIVEYNAKRDIVERLKFMTKVLFGSQSVKYTDAGTNPLLPNDDFKELNNSLFSNDTDEYTVTKDSTCFALRIRYNNIVYGILEAGDFLFPQYISRYISLALGISRVCGLVISNARQYEMLEKAKDDVTYISYHDSLTGLYNRNYFINCMQNHSVTPTTVVFACDIDGLKAVNDKLGHNAGNELIKMAATVLKESFRETDTVTRIGGDEFAILVFDGGKDFAALAKKRIEDAVNKVNTRKNPPPFKLSISTGYSCAESEKMHELLNAASNQESEWDMLIKSADNEMYLEKAFKKNIKT